MIYIILSIITVLVLISKQLLKSKLEFTLITIYVLWYSFLLSISTFNLYELNDVSKQAYFYQLLGVIMLTFGFLIQKNEHYHLNKVHKSLDLNFEKSIGFNIVFILILVTVITVFITFQELLSAGEDVRSIYFEERTLLFGHRYLGMIWTWIFVPFYYLITLLLCIRILNKKFLNIKTLTYALFVILFATVGAGRIQSIIVIEILILLTIINKIMNLISTDNRPFLKTSTSNKMSIYLSAIVLLMVIIFSGYITAIRRGYIDVTLNNIFFGLDIFFEQIIIYNIGPFRAFDYALINDYLGKIGYLYGKGTLSSVFDLIFTFFAALRFTLFEPPSSLINDLLQNKIIAIGKNHFFNYAYTQFMIFYFDYGVLGIALISFLYGIIYRKVIIYFMYNTNLFSLLLVLYISISLIGSNFAYQLQSLTSLIIIIGSLVMSHINRVDNSFKTDLQEIHTQAEERITVLDSK